MRTPRLRLLSVLLAVALFFTLLPVSALAEGGGSNANRKSSIGIAPATLRQRGDGQQGEEQGHRKEDAQKP